MKAESIANLKRELKASSHDKLLDLCLQLARFKKENKELMTYVLYESENEQSYINAVKVNVDEMFDNVNRKKYYFIKKSIRKILKDIKKFIRYSKKKETEVILLMYYCEKLKDFKPSIHRNKVLMNIYERQIELVQKTIKSLHPDLQFDYGEKLEELISK